MHQILSAAATISTKKISGLETRFVIRGLRTLWPMAAPTGGRSQRSQRHGRHDQRRDLRDTP
ncbi:MAG: hypothetical protein ACLP8S_05845 [Solirubrobacteraceae bacterium]